MLKLFNGIQWDDFLKSMEGVSEADISYSPSFSAVNNDNRATVSISALEGGLFYLMYFTPIVTKKLFGIAIGQDGNDLLDLNETSYDTSLQAITFLVNEDLTSLEKLF